MRSKKYSKKVFPALLLMLMILVLCAWGEKPVELLDDQKLIDLNKAIDFAAPGGELVTQDDPAVTAAVTAVTQIREEEIVISIRGERITYNGSECRFEDLEAKLRKTNKEHVRFRLVDDYAESHFYRKTLALLKDLNKEIQLRYSYE